MSRYVLARSAQRDLVLIPDYYLEEAGYRVARRMLAELVAAFRFLAATPGAGHKREDLAGSRPVLFWPVRDYLIVYKPGGKPLQILAILHASRDIPTLLRQHGL